MLRNGFALFTSLMFLTVFSVAAQTSSNVEVSNPQFVYDINNKFVFRYANSTSDSRAPFTTEVVQELSALFRNNGAKKITRVFWEFIVYKNSTRTKIKYIYNFKNKTEILPDNEIRLSQTGRFWGNSECMEAKIFRVEYSDETVWEGARTKN